MTTKFIFTARNAATLSRQVDEAAKIAPDFSVNFGRQGPTRTWFSNGAWGGDVRTGMSFDDLVSDIQGRFDAHIEYAE